MPNKTTNFNPVKFTGGVAKSFVTATTQLIQEYMPFTSNMIEGISSTVFDVKDYAATNRPDRNIREGPGLIKSFANRARNASNALLSDLAKGDLNLESSRNQIGDYLSKFKKDEFDFDFGFDVEGFDFDDDSNANEFDGQDNFTAADFAEGMYESTSAMIGAVETSTKHLALMNAKSNDAMANKLIANDMVNMSRIMPMFDEVNKNIISVNNNLTSIVEYYNSTMNDFIKNTTTHFAKVDQFMDSISKRYLAEEKKENKKDKLSDKIFDGIQLNINNLLKKTIKELDVEFFGGQTGLQSVIKTVSGLFLGDKTPQFINDMEGYMDFGSMLKMFNPMQELVKRVLPGLEQMRDLDAAIKASVGSLKEAFLAMGDETDKSVKGKIFKALRKVIASDDRDDEDFWSSGTRYKKKDISWNTSDSIVLHDLIPDQLSEINSNMVEVGTNVKNIVEILENNTHIYEDMFKSLTDFHIDSIKYYKHATKNRSLRYHYTHAETDANTFGTSELAEMQHRRTIYGDNKKTRQKTLTDYKAAHTFVFNTETGKQELASSVVRKYLGSKQRAYLTGIDAVGSDLHNALSLDEQLKNTAEIASYYGVTQTEIQAFSKTISEFLDAVFTNKLDYKVIIDGRETEIRPMNVISNGQIDARGLVNSINQIADEYGINFKVSGKYNAQLLNTVREYNKHRKEAIKSVQKSYDESSYIQTAMRKEAELTGKSLEFEHQYTATDIQGKINGVSKTKADILKSNKSLARETITASIAIAMMQAEAEGATEDSPRMQALKRQEEELERSLIESNKKNEVIKEFNHGQNVINRALSGVLNAFTGAVTLFGDEMNNAIVGADVKGAAQMAASEIQNIFFNTKLRSDEMLNGEIFNIVYDPETGKPKTYFVSNTRDYDGKNTTIPFGFKKAIGADGKPFGDFIAMVDSEGRTWEKFVEEFESKGYTLDTDGYRPVMRHSTGMDDNGNYIPTVESWVPAYKTGATRIDKDKIVQVHEGEMILDAALSENVRTNFKDMMNAGGYDKLRFEQQEELRRNIGASDERFIGHENEVIDAMNKAISDSNKSDANITDVQLSKESVCFIEGEKEDTIFTSMLKRLTEISINLGTVSRSTILEHINEIKNERKLGNKPLKDILLENILGTKGEDTMYSGGILSDTINSIRDTINHLRFTYYDGKTYKGFERDENGNIIKDDDGKKIVKTYDAGTDETDAILLKIKEKAIENAEYFADNHGWDDKQKAAYVKSVSDMIDGIPGALSGAAVGSFFGLAGTALGAIGGFTFTNKTTRQAIFGEIVKDPDGRHHVVGGIFGKFENKLISTAEEVKDNFVTAAKEVGHNLKLGIKSFLERVTGKKGEISENIKKIFENLENGKGIGGHLIHGIKETVSKVANGVTDIASNAVIVGSKVIFKAVGMPFNLLSSIIGGKEYKKHKREEKFARSDAIDDELIGNLKRYGINTVNATKGIRDALFKERHINIAGKGPIAAIKRNYDYLGMENANREGKDKHFLGEGGKLDNFIDSVTGFFTGGHTLQGTIQSIIAAIASGAFLTLGNPVAATAVMGFAGVDAVVKQIFGLGIAQAGLKGLRRLKTRVDRKFSKARGVAGALMHATKQRLGINDDAYYAKQLIRGDDAKYIDIMSDVGMSEDEQAEFREATKGVKNYKEYKERIKYLENKKKEKEANDEKLGIDESNELDKLNKAKNVFSRLESGLPDEEFNEFQRLKSMKRKDMTKEQKARFRELKDKQEEFDVKYGNSTSRFNTALTALDPRALAMSRWKNSVSSMNATEYFKEAGISDEAAKNAQNYLYKKASIARDKIYKKFGSNLTDADFLDPDKRKEMNEIFKTIAGKDISNYSTQEAMNMVNYFDPNRKTESEKEQEEYHVTVKDMLGSLKDAVATLIPEKLDTILEKIGLKENNKAEPSADLGVGSSRTKYAKMHGFDIGKLKRGDAKEKAWFDKAVDDGELDVETINAITQAVAGHDKVTEEDYNQYASGATNIPHDQIAKLHAGEAVLDAETASTFRKGGFGLASGLNDVFASVKSQLGELVGVFKGDKHGSGEAKKGFLTKMKESFDGVGQKISNSVFGSGLIPIDPLTGKPDIPKIVARAAALLGGIVIGLPLIKNLVDKLKPVFEPIFTGVGGAIKTALGFNADATLSSIVSTIIADNVSKLPETLEFLGGSIADAFNESNKFWENVGAKIFENSYHGDIADAKATGDTTIYNNDPEVIKNRKATIDKYKKQLPGNAGKSTIVNDTISDSNVHKFIRCAQDYFDALLDYYDKNRYCFRDKTGHHPGDGFVLLLKTELKFVLEYDSNFNSIDAYKAFAEKVVPTVTGANIITAEETGNNKHFKLKSDINNSASLIITGIEKMEGRILIFKHPTITAGVGDHLFARMNSLTLNQYSTQSYWDSQKGNARSFGSDYDEISHPEGFELTWDNVKNDSSIGYGYTQNDPRWASMGYGRFKNGGASTMGSGGCGPTALSNVYANLTGRNINPAQMARFAQSNGYNAQGGTSAGLFTSGARKLGLTSNAISKTGSSIGRSIRNGNNVLIAGKNGPYTKAGHIMSIRGVDRYGNAIVDDPLRRGARHIPMNSLTKGMTHAWSIGNGIGFGDAPIDWAGKITGANFNVADGGSFGYDENIDAGCFFNSIINGYIATAVRSGMKFNELKSLLSPAKIQKESRLIGSNGYVSDRDGLINYMNSKTGLNISVTDVMDTSNGSQTNRIVNSVNEGIPVVLHTTNATQGTTLGKIINAFGRNDGRWLSEHAIMIPGTANGKIVIINPRSSTDQINTDYDINTLTDAINNNYLRHTISFTGGKSERQTLFEELTEAAKKGDSFAGKTFVEQFGASPGKYKTYMEYINNRPIKQTSANDANKTNINGNLTGTPGTTTSGSGNWLSELISKLGTFASNLLSGLISGDSSHLLDGVFDNNTSGSYSGGGSGGKRSTTGGSFIGKAESEFNSLQHAAKHDAQAFKVFDTKYGRDYLDKSYADYAKDHGISVTGTSIDGFVTPTSMLSEYNTLPSWAKTPPLKDITNINDYAKAISYTSMIAPLGEAGVEFPPKSRDELNKMYFRIYNDVNAPSFGRRGFHFNPNRTGGFPGDDIFNILGNSDNETVRSDASKLRDYIFSNFSSFPKSPNYYQIDENNGYSKEFLNALIQAEDALNMQLHSQYFNMLRSVAPNLTDPRGYVLAGDLMGVAPYGVQEQLAGSTTFDDVYNRLKTHWGSSHGSRIDRTYGAILNGLNGIPSYEKYVGYGDAGYNMRDKMHMYTDDVYMGDADHPMNVTMDSTPVTSRLDKLVELVDTALNGKPEPVSNGSNAKSVSIGNGDRKPAIKSSDSMKGTTNIGQHDRLADIHNRLARRTRTSVNYNQL